MFSAAGILAVCGLFTIGLGLWHLGVPRWFDFAGAVGREGRGVAPLRPIAVAGRRYATTRADVLGLSWVMSNAASYVLVSVGLLDVAADRWLDRAEAPLIGAWIGGWWALRSVGQLALGRRRHDLAILLGFALLAGVHGAVAAGWR